MQNSGSWFQQSYLWLSNQLSAHKERNAGQVGQTFFDCEDGAQPQKFADAVERPVCKPKRPCDLTEDELNDPMNYRNLLKHTICQTRKLLRAFDKATDGRYRRTCDQGMMGDSLQNVAAGYNTNWCACSVPQPAPCGTCPIQHAAQYGTCPVPQATPCGTCPVPQSAPCGTCPIQHAAQYGTCPVPQAAPCGTCPVPQAVPCGTCRIPSAIPFGIYGLQPTRQPVTPNNNCQEFQCSNAPFEKPPRQLTFQLTPPDDNITEILKGHRTAHPAVQGGRDALMPPHLARPFNLPQTERIIETSVAEHKFDRK